MFDILALILAKFHRCSASFFCQTSFHSLDTFVNHQQTHQRNLVFFVPLNYSNNFMHETDKCFSVLLKREFICALLTCQVMAISYYYEQIAQDNFLFHYLCTICIIDYYQCQNELTTFFRQRSISLNWLYLQYKRNFFVIRCGL